MRCRGRWSKGVSERTRRRAAVRRGGDAPPAGARRRGRRAGDPADLAAVARRAPRPARARAGDRADRRGAGTRISPSRCSKRWPSSTRPACASALERLAEADLLFVEGAWPAGELSLQARADPGRGLRQPAQEPPPGAAPPRGRSALRDAEAEPEAIAHHFTEAGLDDLAIEWWGKAGDQALRRSAFQEAIAHLGKAIAMADKAGGPRLRQPRAATGDAAREPTAEAADRLRPGDDACSRGFASEELRAGLRARPRARCWDRQTPLSGSPPITASGSAA